MILLPVLRSYLSRDPSRGSEAGRYLVLRNASAFLSHAIGLPRPGWSQVLLELCALHHRLIGWLKASKVRLWCDKDHVDYRSVVPRYRNQPVALLLRLAFGVREG